MSIDRVGRAGGVSRDAGSAGFDSLSRRDDELAPIRQPRNEKVDQVSKLYEKQFLGEMVKAMRSTVSFSDASKPSMAENIYRDQLDQEYVDSWGEQGGIGLSDLIYDQIMDRYFNTQSGRQLKQQGPIALSDKDVVRVARVKSEEPVANGQVPLRIEVKPAASSGPTQVQAPWDSTVVSKTRVDGKTAVTLEHGPGLRSTVIFDGVGAAEAEPGTKIKQGEPLGTLSPEIRSFFWNLKETKGL